MNPPPDGYTVRPATTNDIDAMAALVQAVDRHDDSVVEPVRPHLEDEWANPLFHADEDTVLVSDPSGELAAFATCWGIEPSHAVEAWINVHPAYRGHGLGTWLVGWAERRTRRHLPEPATWTCSGRSSLRPDQARPSSRALGTATHGRSGI